MLLSRLGALIFTFTVLIPMGAVAEYVSSQPIKLVVPQVPGSGTDIAARIIAEELAPVVGRAIVVENRPGAFGTIGTNAVAKAEPDGHTLLMIGGTAITAAAHMNPPPPYDPQKDLMPIYKIASSPMVLFVSAKKPVHTLAELIKLVADQPGKHSYAAHHTGNMVAMEALKRDMRLDMIQVLYKGGPAALSDVANGLVTAMFNDISGSTGMMDAGHIRPLAIMDARRSSQLPNIPTLAEANYKGATIAPWTGVFAPAGTPLKLIAYLNAEIGKIVAKPAIQARMNKLGLELSPPNTPETFAAFIREETEILRPLMNRATEKAEDTSRSKAP